jgi:CBS domain-containing protein
MSDGLAQLALVGSYKMPLGPVGAALDIAGLHRVVERTGERLVEALAGQLEEDVAGGGITPAVSAAGAGRLYVADVMSPGPLLLGESLPLRTAALLLLHYDVGGAPVVADSGELIGVLTDADLVAKEASFPGIIGRRARRAERSRHALTAGEACSRPARTTTPQATLHDAAGELLAHDVSRLVVVDDCRIAGMLTRRDVLKALTRQDAELQALAAAELAASGLAGVEARCDQGVVRLSGNVRYRSDAERLHSRIAEIDGIIAIEDELEWEEDDLALPPPMLM